MKARLGQVVLLGLLALVTACQTTDPANAGAAGSGEQNSAAAAQAASNNVDVAFLLSMTYDEAKALGKQSLDMSPYCRLVADNITVLRQSGEGVPLRVRATGKVFIEQAIGGGMVALGQEAYVDRGFEIMMRGRPLLRRGSSVVEGLEENTVFYMRNTRLQVIGNHRVPSKFEAPSEVMMAANPPSGTSRSGFVNASWDVTPTWRTTWEQGPNPLLPALSPDDIPANMRPTPLLPPVTDDAQPRLPGEEVNTPSTDADGRKIGQRTEEEEGLGRRRNR